MGKPLTDENKEFNRKLGKRLQKIRRASGVTQEQLAEKLGFAARQYLSFVESGRNGISVYRLILIARALEIPVCDLLEDL